MFYIQEVITQLFLFSKVMMKEFLLIFYIEVMGFEQFQLKFYVVTVALRRKGSGRFLWSCRLLLVGFL